MSDIKVLMLGGSNSGKKSALASMVHSFWDGPVGQYLTIVDCSEPLMNSIETQNSLTYIFSIPNPLLYSRGICHGTFLIEHHNPFYWWNYHLQVKIPDRRDNAFIIINDVKRYYTRSGHSLKSDIQDFSRDCDVYVIAIETPYLMEAINPKNSLCTDTVKKHVSHIPEIHVFLTYINDNNGKGGKMAVFTPIM